MTRAISAAHVFERNPLLDALPWKFSSATLRNRTQGIADPARPWRANRWRTNRYIFLKNDASGFPSSRSSCRSCVVLLPSSPSAQAARSISPRGGKLETARQAHYAALLRSE
ncbi:hypothetical protein HNQ63_001425 [Wenzhouxiangella marina]|nr:hypothetical protein [Wenzhouxiangella marina]